MIDVLFEMGKNRWRARVIDNRCNEYALISTLPPIDCDLQLVNPPKPLAKTAVVDSSVFPFVQWGPLIRICETSAMVKPRN